MYYALPSVLYVYRNLLFIKDWRCRRLLGQCICIAWTLDGRIWRRGAHREVGCAASWWPLKYLTYPVKTAYYYVVHIFYVNVLAITQYIYLFSYKKQRLFKLAVCCPILCGVLLFLFLPETKKLLVNLIFMKCLEFAWYNKKVVKVHCFPVFATSGCPKNGA